MIAFAIGLMLCAGAYWLVSRRDLDLQRELAAYSLAIACTVMLAGLS